MIPTQVGRCPHCSAPQTVPAGATSLVCTHCGREYAVAELTCLNCGTPNSPDADVCKECGEPLTTVGRVFQRHTDARRPPRFLQQVRQQAEVIKRSEAESSRLRMQSMEQAEARRLEALKEDRSRQTAFDRQLLMAALAGLLGLALLALAWFLIPWLIR